MPRDEKSKDAERVSRLSFLERKEIDPEMPDISAAPHLARFLFQIGPTMPAGMGSGPVTHQEIESWMRTTRTNLYPWEVRLMRELSMAYVSQASKSDTFDAEPPYGSDVANRLMKAARVRESMRRLANRNT